MERLNALSGKVGMVAVVFLIGLIAPLGCQQAAAPSPPPPDLPTTPDENTNWAQVLRWLDDAGLTHNDQRTITAAADIAKLQSFFPEMSTSAESPLHGTWKPSIILHFHRADGVETFVATDYRVYRVDEGKRGDFVIAPGFAEYIDRLFATTSQ